MIMIRNNRSLMIAATLLVVLASAFAGCGGGGGGKSGNGGNNGILPGFAYVKLMDTGEILAFSIDSATGALTPISGGDDTIDDTSNFAEMAADPSGKFLYVAKATKQSYEKYKMKIYEIDSVSGGLTLNQELDMEYSPMKVAVDPIGSCVIVTHNNDNKMTVFSRDSDGKLTLAKEITFKIKSPDATRFEPTAITFDKTGAYLFVAGDECDSSWTFKRSVIHVYDNNFDEVGDSPFETCNKPRSIALGPDGNFLYVATNNSIAAVYYYPINEGKLGEERTSNRGSRATALAVNGNFLYLSISSSTNKDIEVYSINADGSLTKKTGTGFSVSLNETSEMLVVDPSGRYLYTNEYERNVIRGFLINPTNGSLTEIPGSPWDMGKRIKSIAIVGKNKTEKYPALTLNVAAKKASIIESHPLTR